MTGKGALLLAILLLPEAPRAQTPAAGTNPTTAAPRRRVRGGRGGGGGSSSDDSGVAPMKTLPCPKGFTAQVDTGPHLKLATEAAVGKKRRGKKNDYSETASPASKAAKPVLARRCVPDQPKKAASR
jgi:hypothetical protein